MPLSTEAAARKDKLGARHPATLQHRHFAVIAGILADIPGGPSYTNAADHRALCAHFADGLAGTNPNFNRKRFLAACGAKEG